MARDAIKPDITMLLHYTSIAENEKEIVAIEVKRETIRPYYLAKKGMRTEGVYVSWDALVFLLLMRQFAI